MERLIDARRRRDGHRSHPVLRKRNLIRAVADAVQGRLRRDLRQRRLSGVFNNALKLPTQRWLRQAQEREPEARQAARHRASAAISKSPRRPSKEHRKIVFEADGRRHLITGTLGLRSGPRHAARAGARAQARRAVRQASSLAAGRQRRSCMPAAAPAARARSPPAAWRSSKPRRMVIEKGKQIAAACCWKRRPADIEFADGRFTIAGTDRSIGIMRAGAQAARRRNAGRRADVARRRPCHRGERAADLPQRLSRRRGRDRSRDRQSSNRAIYTGVNDFGTIVNPLLVARPVAWRRRARRSARRLMECVSYDESGASRSPVRSWTTRCPAPHRHSSDGGRRPSGARQIQSARHQGLRRSRLRRQPLPPSSTRYSMRSPNSASSISICR